MALLDRFRSPMGLDEGDGLPTVMEIRSRWNKCGDEMLSLRRNYALNCAFYAGDQYLEWDRATRAPTVIDYRNDRDREARMVVNGFRSRTNTLVGRLIAQDLAFEVQPQGLGAASHRRRRLQEHLLEAERRHRDWESIREEEVLAALHGGVAAVSVEWNPKGESLIVSDPVNGQGRVSGGVLLSSLAVDEFGIEPGTRRYTDACWWIRGSTLTPEQAQNRYDLEKPPSPDTTAGRTVFQNYMERRITGARVQNAVTVLVYFERPVGDYQGGVVHVVGDNRIVYPWPFPTDKINLAIFRQSKINGTWLGDTFMNDARQVQRAYNDVRTTIRAHVLRAANARVAVPKGALDDDDVLTNDVAELLEYHADVGGREPHWMQAPDVPRWLQQEPANLSAELDEMFSTHAISKGQQVGDRNSGLALSILAEKDDTPLGPLAREQARGWAQIGTMVLQMLRANLEDLNREAVTSSVAGEFPGAEMGDDVPAVVKATTTLTSSNEVPVVREWTHEDLDEDPVVVVPLESVMPRNRAATKAELIAMAQAFPQIAASIDGATLARMTEISTLDESFAAEDSDVSCAKRENELMLEGETCIPEPWHEHAKHIRLHNDERNGQDYEAADEQIQALFDDHVLAHEMMAMQDIEAQTPREPLALPPGMEGEMPPPGGEVLPPEEAPPEGVML